MEAERSVAWGLVKPLTLQEAVLQQLRRGLLQGEYRPGDPVRVDQVATMYQVSAGPVREALRVLLAEGRLRYEPHRGYTVTALSLREVEEIFLICRLLEAEAIQRAVPRMDGGSIDQMRRLLGELERVPEGEGLWEKVLLHRDFHFVPIVSAGLPRMHQVLTRLWDHTDHYRGIHLFLTDASVYRQMHAEHEEILEACAARDPELAVRLMDQHRDHALVGLARALDRDLDDGVDDPEAADAAGSIP